MEWTAEDIEDLLTDAISDSVDMDWEPRWGAKSILRTLQAEGLFIVPAIATAAGAQELLDHLAAQHEGQYASLQRHTVESGRRFYTASVHKDRAVKTVHDATIYDAIADLPEASWHIVPADVAIEKGQ